MALKTVRKPEPEEKSNLPVYVARAKIVNYKGDERWETIGGAWKAMVNGKEALSVKLNTVPAGQWDGGFLLMPPLESSD